MSDGSVLVTESHEYEHDEAEFAATAASTRLTIPSMVEGPPKQTRRSRVVARFDRLGY